MSDSHAEQLDPSTLGEEVGDDERAAADFPPDEPMAVEQQLIADTGDRDTSPEAAAVHVDTR